MRPPITLLFVHPSGGSISQGGIDDVTIGTADYDRVFYMAAEIGPLDDKGVWAPMADVENRAAYREQRQAAKAAARMIVELVSDGQRVLVTCAQGVNRSSAATGLALKALGCEDPVAWIQARRPTTFTNAQLKRLVQTESL